jgi:hypothetical protein
MFDVFADIPEGDTFEVACLYFWPTNDSERNSQPTRLALMPDTKSNNGIYKRVGLLFCIEPTWFLGVERTIITII